MTFTTRRVAALAGAAAVACMAVAGGVLASPALAEGPYNATVAGFPGNTPLVALAPSSIQPVVVTNLPPNVGVYVLQCKTPADPRQPPTLCDSSADSVNVIPSDPAGRATVNTQIRLNAEFYGMNPNPTGPAVASESVDCRVPTGNPRTTTCTLYILGSGRDSANPAYIRVWPTMYSPVRPDRKTDVATVTVGGKTATATTKLVVNVATPLAVTMQSGLTPSLSSDKCSVSGGKITALANTGTCTLLITTTGGKNYKPFVGTQVFQLAAS